MIHELIRHLYRLGFIISLLVLPNCNTSTDQRPSSDVLSKEDKPIAGNIKYAKGFSIHTGDGYKVVEVPRPFKGAKKTYRYLLVPKGGVIPKDIIADATIQTPVSKLVVTSTSHLPLLELLGRSNCLIGFPNTDLISSMKIRSLVDQGAVTDVGNQGQINLERLLELEPEMVMNFALGTNLDQHETVQAAGIPVVLNADYLEESPLGRAEWIKFAALFFNLERIADSVFRIIEHNYLALQQKAQQLATPSIYTGIVYGDFWYVPGGKSYAAQFMKDAAGQYLWSENQETGSLSLNFEQVFDRAQNADFWIGVGSYHNLEEIAQADPRYKNFAAFQHGQVYNYNARMGAKGGNAYLELGYARPDMVLADLLFILHPESLPNHQLYFYKRLH